MKRLKIILFVLALAGFGGAYGFYQLGFVRWLPEGVASDGRAIAYTVDQMDACLKVRVLGLVNGRSAQSWDEACRAVLIREHSWVGFELRWYAVAVSGMAGLLALFIFALCVWFGPRPLKIVRGGRLYAGRAGLKAFASACAQECKLMGKGVELVEPYPLSRERETQHFLILGSVGSGKTQTMLNLMSGPLVRGDSLLVLDTKGDMMAGLPGEPLLIAPHDARSLVWDVAADCRVKQDARELAARFIPTPSGADPMWSHAAQEIFVACIVHLQASLGESWGWADLRKVVTSDVATLASYAREHNPGAVQLLAQPDSKTTLSILTTFQTHMRVVSVLAEAWPDAKARRFSVRDWLHHPVSYQPLILQQDPGYPDLSKVWIGSLLGLLASAVGSPSLQESRERRIWLFMDEFPQLPPVQNFPAFLELGRSKGIAVVIGAQDLAQIRAVYGDNQAKSWFSMVSTKIIARINAGATAEELSRIIGEQEVERIKRTTSRANGRSSVSESVQQEPRRIITPSELMTRLGPSLR